jgi:hypothetical protein
MALFTKNKVFKITKAEAMPERRQGSGLLGTVREPIAMK